MSKYIRLRVIGVSSALVLLVAHIAAAQTSSVRKERFQRFVQAANRLAPHQRAFLSSSMKNLMRFAARAGSADADLEMEAEPTIEAWSVAAQSMALATAPPGGTIAVSNPSLDFRYSVLGGFTQSTSSSARCGNSVVVGYEDTGAGFRAHAAFQDFDGVSASADGGLTFSDLGHLDRGTDPTAILGGHPSVACSSSSRFYYASLFENDITNNTNCFPDCPMSGLSVSVSTNGGKTWANPVVPVLMDAFSHIVDKPWIAVDPTNPLQVYVTFTDFSNCTAIDLVSSKDGGKTWSAPVILHQECYPPGNIVTGSSVVVSPSGKVHVAYELIPPSTSTLRQILYQRSLDHGQTFSAPLKVSDVVPIGDGSGNNFMQANLQAREFPQIAVDRTNGASRGYLYIAWPDGRNHVKADAFSGTYAYADILVARSTDIGLSFSVLPAVSAVPAGFTGRGRDQFAPGIAVDKTGKVAACYYDRRNDPQNMAIDRYCSVSINHGATWSDLRASNESWVPLDADFLPQETGFSFFPAFTAAGGEYDSLTSDFLLVNPGFFGAFQIQADGNPNVVAKQF